MENDSFDKDLQSSRSFSLNGLGVALITPFNNDKTIDFAALEKLIERQITANTDYLVVLGTTAETPTLSDSEKKEISEFIRIRSFGRIPLIYGIGGNSTYKVTEEIKETDLRGYSAILSVTPYYNKPNQTGLYRHYSEIAKVSPVPVILYNVPGRTGVNLEASTTLKLAEDHKNIIAIKEASGNLKQIEEILKEKPAGFSVISGDDSLTLQMMRLGASGVISVLANGLPEIFGAMVRACTDREFERAEVIDSSLKEVYKTLFADGNPAGIKCMLHEMGLIQNELRLPLVKASEKITSRMREILPNFIDTK